MIILFKLFFFSFSEKEFIVLSAKFYLKKWCAVRSLVGSRGA